MYLTIQQAREKFPKAIIGDGAIIRDGAEIGKGAIIEEGAIIGKGTIIGKGRKGVINSYNMNGFNKWGITGYICDDGLIINIGCMNDYKGLPIDEARAEIANKYPSDHIYFDCLNLIEKKLKQEK